MAGLLPAAAQPPATFAALKEPQQGAEQIGLGG
jgi:hypothetical protein